MRWSDGSKNICNAKSLDLKGYKGQMQVHRAVERLFQWCVNVIVCTTTEHAFDSDTKQRRIGVLHHKFSQQTLLDYK